MHSIGRAEHPPARRRPRSAQTPRCRPASAPRAAAPARTRADRQAGRQRDASAGVGEAAARASAWGSAAPCRGLGCASPSVPSPARTTVSLHLGDRHHRGGAHDCGVNGGRRKAAWWCDDRHGWGSRGESSKGRGRGRGRGRGWGQGRGQRRQRGAGRPTTPAQPRSTPTTGSPLPAASLSAAPLPCHPANNRGSADALLACAAHP